MMLNSQTAGMIYSIVHAETNIKELKSWYYNLPRKKKKKAKSDFQHELEKLEMYNWFNSMF